MTRLSPGADGCDAARSRTLDSAIQAVISIGTVLAPRDDRMVSIPFRSLEAVMTTAYDDRQTARPPAESRRVWDDARVWFVNCVAVEAAYASLSPVEQVPVRLRCDQMLATFLAHW